MDEKKLTEQIQALKQEKNKALAKISELQKQVKYGEIKLYINTLHK